MLHSSPGAMRDTVCLLSAICLLLTLPFTGCFFLGANESEGDAGFCEDRHHQYVGSHLQRGRR